MKDDLICRAEAIKALGERPMVWMDSDYEIAQRNQYDMDKLAIETVPSAQPEQAVKDCRTCKHGKYNDYHDTYFCYNAEDCSNWDKWETSAQPEQHGRVFKEIVVEYPTYSTYPEYEGKPYFSIKYTENGQEFIGYGTYKPEVLSEYLKEYFMSSAQPEQRWIPCSEKLPESIRPVIVTWKNTDPASYYQYIVGKRFIGVAHYKSGKWYWYSSTTEDFLAEYGRYDGEEFDEAIEVLAWCELPEPWKEGEEDDK